MLRRPGAINGGGPWNVFLLLWVLLEENKAKVTVLSSADKWYGVTYKEDKETVVNAIHDMTEQGVYPAPLWK